MRAIVRYVDKHGNGMQTMGEMDLMYEFFLGLIDNGIKAHYQCTGVG